MRYFNLLCATILFANLSYAQTEFESLNYLYSIQGNNTIAGIHNRQPNSNPNSYSQQLYNITGQWPGLYSADFQFESWEISERQTMIDQVITEWNNGAMINLMWHACNPVGGSGACNWENEYDAVKSYLDNTQWQQLLTNGTVINNNWKAMMDDVAYYLQQLEDAGVEVFFRPLHEMNQGVFWWGGRPGPNGTAALYRLTHDYFTYEKGLSNLIWVWNLQDYGSLASDLNSYDPGWNYWDVLTMDLYWTDGQGYTWSKYSAMVNKAAGKPIGIGECGTLPSPSLLDSQPLWTFFMGWSEWVWNENSTSQIQNAYWSSRALVLNEMPGWNGTGSWQNGGGSGGGTQYIQSEDYNNMSGVQTETTSDPGGGNLNVGWIDAGDWMTYDNINIPSSGNYSIAYRVASQSGGGTIRLEQAGGGTVYGSVNVPSTGGWQSWTTIYQTVYLNAGTQSFGIKATAGGWNFNWWSITPTGSSRKAEVSLAVEETLAQAYPNPFSEEVIIPIDPEISESFELKIYDLSGALVREFDAKTLQIGSVNKWNGIGQDGSAVAKGVYTYQVLTEDKMYKGKLIRQ